MAGPVRAFLEEVAAWAGEQADVRAVVLLGSQAREDVPADQFSDVDVVLFVDEPARYLNDAAWLRRFGEPLLTFLEPTPIGGFHERRVLFREGLEVDFAIPPAVVAGEMPPDAGTAFARGFRVLYDDGIGVVVPEPSSNEPTTPTQAQLNQLANEFWYHLLWGAKKLWRGEVLLAKQVGDCVLTGHIVELARWRSRVDTWHGLRFFEQWAGDELVKALGPTFADYDAEDIGQALRAKGALFARLEDDVTQLFDFESPVDRGEILRRLEALTTR